MSFGPALPMLRTEPIYVVSAYRWVSLSRWLAAMTFRPRKTASIKGGTLMPSHICFSTNRRISPPARPPKAGTPKWCSMNSNPNTPVAGLVERLRNPKKWCCIFEHEGQMRHGTTDAPYKAADRIEQLEADNRRLYERLVETQMNAHKWMEAHDKLHSGKPYEFPKPADLPETVAQLEAGKRALESRIAATIKVIEEGYPGTSKTEQCKHGHYGFEECIACYDEALLSAISNPSPVKGTE